MVLLTSSAISAVLSAGVVCIFTFLLFLSGYVLQQQTVRSLQEALRNPPEKPWFPTPVLPPQFREERGDPVVMAGLENETTRPPKEHRFVTTKTNQHVLGFGEPELRENNVVESKEPSALQLWREHVAEGRRSTEEGDAGSIHGIARTQQKVQHHSSGEAADQTPDEEEEEIFRFDNMPSRLAYIFSTPEPSDLCSAALFINQHRSTSKMPRRPNMILIYPATWETSDLPVHTDAMDMIREMQEQQEIICHPVSISRIWAGVSVESQLLAELQRTRWTYDRALYLRSPGMALNMLALDRALVSSGVKTSWQGLSSKSTTLTPPMLLYVPEKGLLAPKGVTRKLTAEVKSLPPPSSFSSSSTKSTRLESRRAADGAAAGNTIKAEDAATAAAAAYLIFDQEQLTQGQQSTHNEFSQSAIEQRFERDRRNVCAGTSLLD